MLIFRNPKLYTIDILYYIPKTLILQEFIWQCSDIAPKYPRIHRFLDHWYYHIDTVTHSINITESYSGIKVHNDEFRA